MKDEYTFGRGETCDYCFESHGGRMNAHFLALSKTHFRIFRVRKPPHVFFMSSCPHAKTSGGLQTPHGG